MYFLNLYSRLSCRSYFLPKTLQKVTWRRLNISKQMRKECAKESLLTLKLFITGSGVCLVNLIHYNTALCQSGTSRAVGYPDQTALSSKDVQFQWKQFLQLLLPEVWSLLGAVSVSWILSNLKWLNDMYQGWANFLYAGLHEKEEVKHLLGLIEEKWQIYTKDKIL